MRDLFGPALVVFWLLAVYPIYEFTRWVNWELSYDDKVTEAIIDNVKPECLKGRTMDLNDKLTQITSLYDVKLAVSGETNPSSTARLVDYISLIYGQEIVKRLAEMTHADLRQKLGEYNITEIKK